MCVWSGRMEFFFEVFGNVLLRVKTYEYMIEQHIKPLIQCVTPSLHLN